MLAIRMTTILFLILGTASTAQAADANATPPSAAELAAAVKRLGADDYQTRAQATAWLWAAGPAAEPVLTEGLKSSDAEVVARCRDLLDKIPYGITPDTPRRFVELIAAARGGGAGGWPGVVPELLDLGPRGMDVARKLVERIASNDSQREAMNHTLDLEGWRIAAAALAAGETERAERLLERSAVASAAANHDLLAVRHYAAFLSARGRLASEMPRWQGFIDKSNGKSGERGRMPDGTPGAAASQIILFHLARLAGDTATARKLAEAIGRSDLKETALFDLSAWQELADSAGAENRSAPIVSGLKAIYSDLAGKSEASRAAIDEIKTMTVSRTSATAPPLVFRALLYVRKPADAIDLLDKYKGIDGALPHFELLCQQHHYDAAFKALARTVGDRTTFRWQWDTAKLRVHLQRGEHEPYARLLAALTQYEKLTQPELPAAQDCVEQLVALRHTNDALPIAAALLNSGVSTSEVFGKLYPKSPLGAETWWRYLRIQHPTESLHATMARLPALLDKRLATQEGRAAIEALDKFARAQNDADRWLEGLADACDAAGLNEEARRYGRDAAEQSNVSWMWLRLGDLEAAAGRYPDAAAAYDKARQADPRQPLMLWLYGWALGKAQKPGGREACDLAHVMMLADEDARLRFAEDLSKRAFLGPELIDAVRQQRRFVPRLNGPGSSFGRNAMSFLSGDAGAFTDRLEAANAAQNFLIRMMRTNAYFKKNTSYLTVLHRLANERAKGLLAKNDVEGAMREAEVAQTTLPGNGEPAGTLVVELGKKGRTAEADKLYAATAAIQDQLCRDFPRSADFHNSRAWLSARCRRNLDLGLDHARKAVELDPAYAGYRETLAEVLFQREEQAAALAEIKKCCELDSKNVYYAKQKRRIEAGDRNASLPEGR